MGMLPPDVCMCMCALMCVCMYVYVCVCTVVSVYMCVSVTKWPTPHTYPRWPSTLYTSLCTLFVLVLCMVLWVHLSSANPTHYPTPCVIQIQVSWPLSPSTPSPPPPPLRCAMCVRSCELLHVRCVACMCIGVGSWITLGGPCDREESILQPNKKSRNY